MLSCEDEAPAQGPPVTIGDGDLDAAPSPMLDAAMPGALDGSLMPSGCSESGPRFSAPFAPGGSGFDVAVDGLDVHVAYTTVLCPGVGNDVLGHELRYARFQTSGPIAEPTTIPLSPAEQCRLARDPVFTVAGGDAPPALHFLSNREGSWGLYRTDPTAEAKVLTRLTVAGDASEFAMLAGSGLEGVPQLAWVSESVGGESSVMLWAEGSARTLFDTTKGLSVQALAISALGEPASSLLLALASASDGGDYFLVRTMLDGTDPSPLAPLGSDVGGTPVVSLLGGADSGAFVYTEGPGAGGELRFLALDAAGEPRSSERKITTGNEDIRDPDVVAFATGYVVAYRVLRRDDPARATLRLAFLDSEGNLAGTRDLLETSGSGGPVKLLATVDGRLVVAFADVSSEGTFTLEVARVTCSG